MRTKSRLALAATTVGALTIATAAPVGAQEEPEALGFAVNATQGPPGALVLGQVDTEDVAEFCTTDVEEFQQLFLERTELMLEVFYGQPFFPDEVSTSEDIALTLLGLIALGILFDVDIAADALGQTFVMTFADIATQDPVGDLGSFDPGTGKGSVIVPDIDPGLWAVAAACVSPATDEATIREAVSTIEQFVIDELGVPETFEPTAPLDFVFEFFELESLEDVEEFLAPIAPTLLEPWMQPDAFGAVLFCILDDQGNCPEPPPPPPPGGPPPPPSAEPAPAQPVVAAPSFTG